MKTNPGRLVILSGTHHEQLAIDVAKLLTVPLEPSPLTRFANGEAGCRLKQSVRGSNVFVLQTHSADVNDAIMEQAIMIDAAKRASARHITAICPYYGYSRQDRKAVGREPITARLVADILTVAGADRIVSVDLHTGQIQGFFNGSFDHLVALPVLTEHLAKRTSKDCVVVAPDAGRVKLAERYAHKLGADLAIVHKQRRAGTNEAEALRIIGDVRGRDCIIVDDMIDGGGTLCAAALQLQKQGAVRITAAATHGLFSPPAFERLIESPIDSITVTDSLPQTTASGKLAIEVVSIAPLLAQAIEAIHKNHSLSALFDGGNQV